MGFFFCDARDEAEGFCYVNDIGIGLQRLRSRFRRILYIDLDVHHGDGVEEAFAHTRRVFTLSFHQYEVGFYPGSGAQAECGLGAGKGYCANFPYRSHIHGERFVEYFKKYVDRLILGFERSAGGFYGNFRNYRTARAVVDQYKPEVCVVQCGADSIVGDPLGGTNLIPEDIGSCIELILSWQRPTIFLGGGEALKYHIFSFISSIKHFIERFYYRRLQFSKRLTILDISDGLDL